MRLKCVEEWGGPRVPVKGRGGFRVTGGKEEVSKGHHDLFLELNTIVPGIFKEENLE